MAKKDTDRWMDEIFSLVDAGGEKSLTQKLETANKVCTALIPAITGYELRYLDRVAFFFFGASVGGFILVVLEALVGA